ncbi:MAG: histone-like nucleoid-structuring protein Lsr2 [Nocardioidaceae bacterium]
MAQKVQILLVDDLDGGKAEETVAFSLDGSAYEIDLSVKNAARLRKDFAPYVAEARKVGGRRKATRGRPRAAGAAPAEIRQWARDKGYDVPDRGRVSAEVREAYAAAH